MSACGEKARMVVWQRDQLGALIRILIPVECTDPQGHENEKHYDDAFSHEWTAAQAAADEYKHKWDQQALAAS